MADGGRVIERLAASLGDAADIQIDIFWAVSVGPIRPRRSAASVPGSPLHLKDGVDLPPSAYGDTPFVNVPVGTGVVDPGPAVAAAESVGSVDWLIVEFDHVDVRRSTRRAPAWSISSSAASARPA